MPPGLYWVIKFLSSSAVKMPFHYLSIHRLAGLHKQNIHGSLSVSHNYKHKHSAHHNGIVIIPAAWQRLMKFVCLCIRDDHVHLLLEVF